MPAVLPAPSAAMSRAVPDCSDQLAITIAASKTAVAPKALHTVRITLHNVGQSACRLWVRPHLIVRNAIGKELPIRSVNPFGWHHGLVGLGLGHGPVMPQVVVPKGGSASTDVSWNTKETLGPACFETAALALPVSGGVYGGTINAGEFEWKATVCGGYSDDVRIEQSPLLVDDGAR